MQKMAPLHTITKYDFCINFSSYEKLCKSASLESSWILCEHMNLILSPHTFVLILNIFFSSIYAVVPTHFYIILPSERRDTHKFLSQCQIEFYRVI